MGLFGYFEEIVDAIQTRKAKKELIESLETVVNSQRGLIKSLKELQLKQEEHIAELKETNDQLLEQLEKTQTLSEEQYNKLVFLCKENAKLQDSDREYKHKTKVLIDALSSTRKYLDNYTDVGKDFALNNPPSGQFMIIDAALNEGLRPIVEETE